MFTATVIDDADNPLPGWRLSHYKLCGWAVDKVAHPNGRDYAEFMYNHTMQYYEVVVFMKKGNLFSWVPFGDVRDYLAWSES